MSAWQQAGLHRLEVSRDIDGNVTDVRFVCDGTAQSACHLFPDCACEQWSDATHGENADPGHENVMHETQCWVDPWFNDVFHSPLDWMEAFAPGDGSGPMADQLLLHSGQIDTTFEGDYMTWQYASPGSRGGS